MSVVTLPPLAGTWTNVQSTPSDVSFSTNGGNTVQCITNKGDGKNVLFTGNHALGDGFFVFGGNFDTTDLPNTAVINSFVFTITHKLAAPALTNTCFPNGPNVWTAGVDLFSNASIPFPDVNSWDAPNVSNPINFTTYADWVVTIPNGDPSIGLNPFTGLAWTWGDLNTYQFGILAGLNAPDSNVEYDIDYVALIVDYTASSTNPCWYNALTNQWASSATSPGSDWQRRSCPAVTAQTTIDPVFGSTLGGD